MLRCTTKDQIQFNKQEYAVLSQFNSEYVTKVYDQLQFQFDSANYLVILMERCACKWKENIKVYIKYLLIRNHSTFFFICCSEGGGVIQIQFMVN